MSHTYSAVTSGETDPESPFLTSLANKFANNLLAVIENDATAPEINGAAITNLTIPYAALNLSNSIVQTDVAPNSIGQSEIKETTTEQTESSTANWNSIGNGGLYLLGWQARVSSASEKWAFSMGTIATNDSESVGMPTLYQSTPFMFLNTTPSPTSNITKYFNSTYITASRPYSLGYGDIEQFIFLLLDAAGNVVATYVGENAPWHYAGKTSIKADGRLKDGTPIRRMRQVEYEVMQAGKTLQQFIGEEFAGKRADAAMLRFERDDIIEVPIDDAIKNADMPDIPHPFAGVADLANKTVVVLDPNARITQRIARMKDNINSPEFSFSDEFLYADRLIIDNRPVANNSGFHPSVMCVNARLK